MYDMETGSRNPTRTQPIQLAAIAIDARTLEVIPNSEFNTLIQPIMDKEQQAALGLDDLEQQALDKNGKKVEDLIVAPSLKIVWSNFVKYVENYNVAGGKWDAPILCGFNNRGFDDVILNRISRQFGPHDKEYDRCALFHPVYNMDVLQLIFPWFESNFEVGFSLSMDNLLKFFKMNTEGTHDALVDVKNQAEIMIRLIKLMRAMGKRVDWQGSKV